MQALSTFCPASVHVLHLFIKAVCICVFCDCVSVDIHESVLVVCVSPNAEG